MVGPGVAEDFEAGVVAGARDEKDTLVHQRLIPGEVGVAFVADHHAGAWQGQPAGFGDIAGLAVGQADEGRQMAIEVEAEVQLRRPFAGLVGGPGKDAERQLEEARIEHEQLVRETKVVARSERGAPLQQLAAERLVQLMGLLGVDPGERGARRHPRAQMVEP